MTSRLTRFRNPAFPNLFVHASFFLAVILASCALAGCTSSRAPISDKDKSAGTLPAMKVTRVTFADLDGWHDDNHVSALDVFYKSCEAALSKKSAFAKACAEVKSLRQKNENGDSEKARAFFEKQFTPFSIADEKGNRNGLFTGYYEPEFAASRTRQGIYQTPLLGVPSDLAIQNDGETKIFGRMENGRLIPYYTRAQIEAGGLDEKANAIAYLADPVDAFVLHVQGSGRLKLEDGQIMRVGFAAKNGRPYHAIGATLIAWRELTRENVSMPAIRAWITNHPGRGGELMATNESYIFFRELNLGPLGGPLGAQGIALTDLRSLAVDKKFHELGLPLWLETRVPARLPEKGLEEFRRLMFAQDTGSAITGPIRGDIYFGSGALAGEQAGHMKEAGRLYVFLPPLLAQQVPQ